MSNLPPEVIVEILSWLPVKPLLTFKSICKPWETLISSSYFINLHLNHSTQAEKLSLFFKSGQQFFDLHSPIDFQLPHPRQALQIDFPFHNPNWVPDIIGSCNGLLCLSTSTNTIFLLNPSTRSIAQLPNPPAQSPGYHFYVFAFGYSFITRQYKVLRFVYGSTPNPYQSLVQVCTLGTSSWRGIADIPLADIRDRPDAALVNGSLHWMATKPVNNNQTALSYVILSFDVGNEEFCDIPLPQFDTGNNYNMTMLGEIRGSLCMFRNFYQDHVEVWVMKEYGARESWVRQFVIREPAIFGCPMYFKPFRYLKTGDFLLRRSNGKLVVYDPRSENSTDAVVRGVPDFFVITEYVESLVSVEDAVPEHT